MSSIGSVGQVQSALSIPLLFHPAASCGLGIENTNSSKTPFGSAPITTDSKLPTPCRFEFLDRSDFK
jgi:hypothetical protein